ncbi:hypothetical protein QYF36_013645 [Acer negundo]|nr:hypothetical protein QYF36_013645 [Acer negundo]
MFRAFALSYNGPGSSRLFIVSLRFCHPPSPRAGFRLLFIALGHSSEMSSVPREGLPTECDPWSPYLIIPDYWIDPIAYLPARTNGAGSKSSPTCFGAFGRERVFWLPQGRVKLSLQPRDDSSSCVESDLKLFTRIGTSEERVTTSSA